ncbi:MAG: alpha/beta hydrolase [Pseudomonadota bacterium]
MGVALPSSANWAESCNADGEFREAARLWNGGLKLSIGERELAMSIDDGVAAEGSPDAGTGVLHYEGDDDIWSKLLAAVPPRFHTDIFATANQGLGVRATGDDTAHAQYYAAAMRAMEILRPPAPARNPIRAEAKSAQAEIFDAPVGRYVHLDLDGHDHRIYFEEAGQGIPLLVQHTAGAHGAQWRHLFEYPEITDHFRLIAYDLPFHGKSMPPPTKDWWTERYNLGAEFLRSVPVKLAAALGLERPAFMGCSVGGLLALDLAYHEADKFRAVVAVEGTLNIEGSQGALGALSSPQIGNDYKARAMEGMTAPSSPLPYVKETGFHYASGWPQLFLGDLHYYIEDYDLRNSAAAIDTDRTAVHIMAGEYDHSGTLELAREAHEAIRGSTFTEMKGVGHFPMCEDPETFMKYLGPVLAEIRAA